jgi:urease accessory protein
MLDGGVLRLLWLASPALPIGAYAYSRGLEYAVHAGHVHDADSTRSWIDGVLEHQLSTLDGPVLIRLYDAFQRGALDEVARWNHFLRAARESKETALEDRQLGLGLLRVLRDAGIAERTLLAQEATYAALFALACVHWQVARRSALVAYLFAFVETQITAASKLVPLGQSSGQRVMGALLERIEPLADEALSLRDDELGAYTPGLALASALHETQYTRLFRS